MANAMEGIMGLPNNAPTGGQNVASMIDMQALEQASAEANRDPMTFREGVLQGMQESDPRMVAEFKRALSSMQLPDDVLQSIGLIIEEVLRNPADYANVRAEILKDDVEGILEELLPEAFDMAYFMALDMALDQLAMNVVQEPPTFADGGLATLNPIARAMASQGRGGDTMLAHIRPAEARMLRARGGSGTINPATGLPEFGFFKSITKPFRKAVKAVTKVVKKTVSVVKNVVSAIAENPIGRIALTIGATMLMGPAGLNFAGGVFGASGAVAFGINTAAASTLVNVASGQKFGDALKGGVVSGVMAGGMAHFFPSTLPSSYTTPAAGTTALPGIEDLTTKAGDMAATPGTGFTGPASVADVTVGTPMAEVYTPGDVGVSAAAPTPIAPSSAMAPMPSMGAQPVWDPNLGEMTLNGIPASQITAGAPTSVAPMGAYNMPASYANPALAPTSAPSLGGGYSVADQYGTAMSRAPVTGAAPAGVPPAAAPTATGPGFLESIQQGDLGGAYEAAKQNTMDVWNNYLSPNRPSMMPSGDAAAEYTRLTGQPFVEGVTPTADKLGWEAAVKAASTGGGMLAKYAPLAGVGLGAAYLGGAFEPIPEEPPLDIAGMYDYELEPFQYGGANTSYQLNPMAGEGGTQFQGTGYQGQYQFDRGQYNPYDYTVRGLGIEGLSPLNLNVTDMPSYRARNYAEGGAAEYPRKNGHISGPGGPKDDKIPAMLSDGEFVFTAQAVRNMGNGSRRKGAKKMYALMKALEGRAS